MLRRCRCLRGFTLLEVLVVMAVLAMLVALALGMADATRERAAISRARSELALLAEALEQYRARHGDYPQLVAGSAPERVLYRALAGQGGSVGPRSGRFGVATVIETGDPGEGDVFLDPWGSPYVYRYRSAENPSWRRRGYVLLSLGPSALGGAGKASAELPHIPDTGLLPNDYHHHEDTQDNILQTP